MKKIWYLSGCSTCERIIKELELKKKGFEFIDIRDNPIDSKSLDAISKATQMSYEELFSKRSMKYKGEEKESIKSEKDFRDGILKEYTFMKRPIIQIDDEYFVGNSKSVIEEAKNKLN